MRASCAPSRVSCVLFCVCLVCSAFVFFVSLPAEKNYNLSRRSCLEERGDNIVNNFLTGHEVSGNAVAVRLLSRVTLN
jgi:hypothetical protein